MLDASQSVEMHDPSPHISTSSLNGGSDTELASDSPHHLLQAGSAHVLQGSLHTDHWLLNRTTSDAYELETADTRKLALRSGISVSCSSAAAWYTSPNLGHRVSLAKAVSLKLGS